MMRISCEVPGYVYGDNQYVLENTTLPGSTLKKKSQRIVYHFVQEGAARDKFGKQHMSTLTRIRLIL